MMSMPMLLWRSARRHSSEQYKGTGVWSMIVLCRTGAVGAEVAAGDVGDGGGAAVEAVMSLFAGAAVDFWIGERRMAPLGLTRPVPCTSPPVVRARTVPVLLRVRAALVAVRRL